LVETLLVLEGLYPGLVISNLKDRAPFLGRVVEDTGQAAPPPQYTPQLRNGGTILPDSASAKKNVRPVVSEEDGAASGVMVTSDPGG
jgi:hypothetical protein